jgi:hypothetical protein
VWKNVSRTSLSGALKSFSTVAPGHLKYQEKFPVVALHLRRVGVIMRHEWMHNRFWVLLTQPDSIGKAAKWPVKEAKL